MNDRYVSPLSERYASREMQYIFSPDKKFKTWRKLWIALAETEYELGLSSISREQIEELKAHADSGTVYYKYGRKQRMLASAYLLTDSLRALDHTTLGEKINSLQEMYDSLGKRS